MEVFLDSSGVDITGILPKEERDVRVELWARVAALTRREPFRMTVTFGSSVRKAVSRFSLTSMER